MTFVDTIDRDIGLVGADSVAAISATGSAGVSRRYARGDHTHEGVRQIIAGTGISITPSGGKGVVTVSGAGGPVIVDKVQTTAKFLESVTGVRYGTPLAFKFVGSSGCVRAVNSDLHNFPCIGLLITDTPAVNAVVDIVLYGVFAVHNSVFSRTITNADIGKPVIVVSTGRLVPDIISSGNLQRVGVIKDISGVDIIVAVNPDLTVIEI